MRTESKVFVLALCAALPLLMAPSGGFPSRPRFQAVTVAQATGGGFNPLVLCANGEASGERCWQIRIGASADLQINAADDAGAFVDDAVAISRSGSTVTAINFVATAVQVNGGTITSGTYTPTINGASNLDSVTGNVSQYLRVRDVVTVSGSITVDPTAAASTIFDITLPIASNLANPFECAGTGAVNQGAVPNVLIQAVAADDECRFSFTASGTASTNLQFSYTYRII